MQRRKHINHYLHTTSAFSLEPIIVHVPPNAHQPSGHSPRNIENSSGLENTHKAKEKQ